MAKQRGRKRTTDLYFGPEEEKAVVRFLESECNEERNTIYNKWLRKPLDKMIESIIRKYELYRKGETFEDLHSDTLSFLITKADKFDKDAGKRAYSYYGTICKNYLLGLLIKDERVIKQNYSYEDIPTSDLEKNYDLTYEIDNIDIETSELIEKLIEGIDSEINSESLIGKRKISENEKKVGFALIDILNDREYLIAMLEGGNKYHKNAILETMRNYTNLSTKDIRMAMRRFKILYNFIKITGIEDGFE
jgi:hypothetical protein